MSNTVDHIEAIGGGGGGSSTFDITETAHGFAVLDVVYESGTGWAKSQANAEGTAEVFGVVSEVVGANSFKAVSNGLITANAHGLGADGAPLYLSEATAGLLTTSEPGTGISKPVAYVVDANNILVIIQRGADVDGSSTNWVFPETTFTADGSGQFYDHSHIIGSESSIVVIAGGVVQSTTAYTVGNDGNGARKRVTLGFVPANGVKVVIRSLGIPYNTPVATGEEPWTDASPTTNAVAGGFYLIDAGDTINLPTSPSDNDIVYIGQLQGDLNTTPATIDGGTKNISDNINPDATTWLADANFAGRIAFVFKTAIDKWKVL